MTPLSRERVRSSLAVIGLTVWVILFAFLAGNQYQVYVGTIVGTYAISAIGLTVVAGRAGQLSLGQAAFMAIGGYSVAYSTMEWHIPFLVALAGGALIALLFGIAVGWIALRLRGNYLAMATLAFGLVIYGLLNVNGPLGGPLGLERHPADLALRLRSSDSQPAVRIRLGRRRCGGSHLHALSPRPCRP